MGKGYASVVEIMAGLIGAVFVLGAIDAGLNLPAALVVGAGAIVVVFLLMYV